MKFPCPHCGTILEAAAEHQGKKADCAYCSGKFTIPTSAEGALNGLDPGELLARGLATVPPPGADGWEAPDPEELQMLLPQYQIESLIGRGGMGAVYKGSQKRLGRSVAIKLLPAELAEDEGFVARFEREARTLAHLDHPGIIQVYDFGQTDEGHFYFVMEFVDGTDLYKMIHGPGVSPPQALEIIAQVCDALQFAHSKEVVHRDIKPANILVTTDGRVKLADFGLARPMGATASGQLTLSRVIMGTPDYMAPEQKRGEGDHRIDLYALGVMLYEMLCGRIPQGAWQPPSQRVHVDVRLDQVVIKAMQEEPELRYQQASEVKTDVDAIRTSIAKKSKPTPAKATAKSPTKAPPPKAPGTSSLPKGRSDASFWKKPAFIAAAVFLPLLGAGAWLGLKPSVKPLQSHLNPESSKVTAPPSLEEALVRTRWMWKSEGSSEFPIKFLPGGKVEVPVRLDWITGWTPEGTHDFRVNSKDGYFWNFEMAPDMANAKTKSVPVQGCIPDSKSLSAILDDVDERKMDALRAALKAAGAGDLLHGRNAVCQGRPGKLTVILHGAKLRDLSVLRGYPVAVIYLAGSTVTDLSAVRDLPLERINMGRPEDPVPDIRPLADCPNLEMVGLSPGVTNVEPLRKLPKLKYISYRWDDKNNRPSQTAQEFWKEHPQIASAPTPPVAKVMEEAEGRALATQALAGWMKLPEWEKTKNRLTRKDDGWSLNLVDMPIGQLAPLSSLKSLPLKAVIIPWSSIIKDPSSIQGLQLTHLHVVIDQNVSSLEPLHGLPVTALSQLGGQLTSVSLKGLENAPLQDLFLANSKLANIEALRGGKTLRDANFQNCYGLKDISALQGAPLETLILSGVTSLQDFAPLLECKKLRKLEIMYGYPAAVGVLKPSGINTINRRPAADYWKTWDKTRQAEPEIKRLRTAIQAACGNTLKDPDFAICATDNDSGLHVQLTGVKMPGLDVLKGWNITELAVGGGDGGDVNSLEALRGSKVRYLHLLPNCRVTDLSPLADCPNLVKLHIHGKVTDIRPVAGCPNLEMIGLGPAVKDIEPLRKLPKLKYISYRWDEKNNRPAQTAEEFWKEHQQKAAAEGTVWSGNGHRYALVPTDGKLTWDDAWKLAESRGGHLATLANQAERDWVIAFILGQVQRPTGGAFINCLLGGRRDTNAPNPKDPRSFRWITGEAFDPSLFKSGEPNNWPHAGVPEDKLAIRIEADSKRDGLSDSVSLAKWHHYYLIEWEPSGQAASPAPSTGQWIPMFNGKDLAGWRSNAVTENQPEGVFAAKNGELVVSGGPAMLFYVGPGGDAGFKNFEFKARVKTSPGSNSGIYFHTSFQEKGWPNAGYECQVNATNKDPKKTGGLYAVADVQNQAPHKDDEWFDCEIRVDGKRIVIKINGKVTTDWTQPADWDPAKTLKNMPGRKLGEGTIALQGFDSKVTYYKDIFIKPLP